MLRGHVLRAAAGVVMPAVAAAGETAIPVVELGTTAFVSAPPAARSALPALAKTPVARLVWQEPTSVALGTEAVVRSEVARLLREMGVEATWRRGEPQELARPGELRVIFLNIATRREHGTPVLGATPARFHGEPFVWVHVPSVRAAAGIASERTGPGLDIHTARRLGIALARVIAHEAVHAIAPLQPHGGGLMSARLDRGMLTAASIAVDPEVGLAVRAALLGSAPVERPADSILAVETASKESRR